MPTTRIPRDFKEFLKSLDAHNARFLLIGGYAVNDDDLRIPTISPDDLKRNKLASGRKKDLLDLDELP